MNDSDPILEMYIFESNQMIEQTEAVILDCELANCFSAESINQIFRNMHTLKGSSSMMQYMQIAEAAHAIEDLFHHLREDKPIAVDFKSLSDVVLQSVDFFKDEIGKISNGEPADGSATSLIHQIQQFLATSLDAPSEATTPIIHHDNEPLYVYHAIIYFYKDCEMENIRAFQLVHQLAEASTRCYHEPVELIEDSENSIQLIKDRGFHLMIESTLQYEQMHELLMKTSYLDTLELHAVDAWLGEQLADEGFIEEFPDMSVELNDALLEPAATETINSNQSLASTQHNSTQTDVQKTLSANSKSSSHSQMISVHVEKLDRLMDLVGELVIAEAMFTSLDDTQHNGDSQLFKASGQLRKITGELQDTVMSIRMIPLTATFLKMRRVSRDMSRKLNKDIEFILIGDETEIDKTVIDHISDPLMHLVRNAIDHGIESAQERQASGKSANGTVTLEAKNIGSDVLVMVKDDGKGLNRDKIIAKAISNGLLTAEDSEISDRDAYNLIFHPGLSTKEQITEFSGRGVGMDVVASNIGEVGGTIYVDSVPGEGTTVTMKIPLTLAIIDGMNVRVGSAHYTLPTTSIKESFRPQPKDLITDPSGNRMVMVRGEIYSIVSLHERFHHVSDKDTDYTQGILIMIELDDKSLCLFVDELIGQQQVVIKPLPPYFRKLNRNINGLSGCTLLGDGSISLILNIAEVMSSSHVSSINSN